MTTEYDYLTAMLRTLMANTTLKSKVDAFYIDFPMSKIRDALATNETMLSISLAHNSIRGSWGSAVHHIQENKAIIQVDIISQKGDNAKYCHEIAAYVGDLLYLWVDTTLNNEKYQIYNDHIDIDIIEYNVDYSAWHIVLSAYMEWWRVAG